MLVQNKVPKQKDTPHPTPRPTAYGHPALLINKGVCGTRAFSTQTVLDEIPFIDCVARRGARGNYEACEVVASKVKVSSDDFVKLNLSLAMSELKAVLA